MQALPLEAARAQCLAQGRRSSCWQHSRQATRASRQPAVISADRQGATVHPHEAAIEAVISEEGIDTVILARYMQIFSKDFCDRHAHHTINIHHSFLPAFEGAKPYHRAHQRGVKLIGATAHFATAELDAGPIIDQHTTRISHRDSVDDMVRKGRDLERLVLARAVRWNLDDRVLVAGNKTVVFED